MAGYGQSKKDSNNSVLGKDIEDIYQDTLDKMDEELHPRIVENFLKNGYRTKRPELQEIELEMIMNQKQIENEALLSLRDFQNSIDLAFNMAKSTQLMNMRIEDVIAKIEKAKGIKVKSIPQLLAHMATLSNEEALMAEKMDRSSNKILEDCDDVDMFVDDDSDESFKTPPTHSTNKKTQPSMFPNPSEMVIKTDHKKFTTPSAVFRFGSAVPPSTNKAPRHLKPNEVAFSVSGSPVYVPKINPVIDRNNERFTINDNDGKKIVDVVLIQGEEEKTKEYKSVVTDIRGIVATRSTVKKTRVLPPRIPTRGAATSSASSAMKKPNQKPNWN